MANALIHRNDESGDIQFSVALDDDPENWLDSFYTRAQAERFIKKNNLNYDPETGYRNTVQDWRYQ